jgi:hypothetical protein
MHCEIYKNWTILIGATESGGWIFHYTPHGSTDALSGGIEYPSKAAAIAAAHELIEYQAAWGEILRLMEDWLARQRINLDDYHEGLAILANLSYLGFQTEAPREYRSAQGGMISLLQGWRDDGKIDRLSHSAASALLYTLNPHLGDQPLRQHSRHLGQVRAGQHPDILTNGIDSAD